MKSQFISIFSSLRKLRARGVLVLATGLLAMLGAHAQETVCARVKIEIKQELTLERQAFDAEMKINNTTDTGVIENVAIEVKITDEAGTPVLATDNPNDLSAKFFVRLCAAAGPVCSDARAQPSHRASLRHGLLQHEGDCSGL